MGLGPGTLYKRHTCSAPLKPPAPRPHKQATPLWPELLRRALDLVEECPCAYQRGCPGCVQHLECKNYVSSVAQAIVCRRRAGRACGMQGVQHQASACLPAPHAPATRAIPVPQNAVLSKRGAVIILNIAIEHEEQHAAALHQRG